MALSEQAQFIIATIDEIIAKHDLERPALPLLIDTRKSSKKVSIIENPMILHATRKDVNSTIMEAPTPFVPLYSKPKPALAAETDNSSTLRFEENPKSLAWQLLQDIKLKIETPNNNYLQDGSPLLAADITKINKLLSLKPTKFRALAADFINLANELSFILNAERNSILFERYVEEPRNTRTQPQPRETTEVEEEEEDSCFSTLSKCKSSYS